MKKLIVVLTLAMMISGSVLSASAEEVNVTEETIAVEQTGDNSGTIVPMADQIVVKFRVYQGKNSIDIGTRLMAVGLSLIGLLMVNCIERPRTRRGFSFYKEKLKNNSKFLKIA